MKAYHGCQVPLKMLTRYSADVAYASLGCCKDFKDLSGKDFDFSDFD